MAAPLNNQFYKYRKISGAPIKYTANQLEKMWTEYLLECENTMQYKNELIRGGDMAGQIVQVPYINPLTIKSFCIFSGISENTFNGYCNAENENIDKDLFNISTHIRESIIDYIDKGCTNGSLNAAYGARLTGRTDNSRLTVETDKPINLVINGSQIDLTE